MMIRPACAISVVLLLGACAPGRPVQTPPSIDGQQVISTCEHLSSPPLQAEVKLKGQFSTFDESGLRQELQTHVLPGNDAWTAVHFVVSVTGEISNAMIATSSAPDAFNQAVIAFIQRAMATPTTLNGQPINYPYGCAVVRIADKLQNNKM